MYPLSSSQDIHGLRIAHITSVPFFLVTQLKGQMQHLHAQGVHITMVTSQGDELKQLERNVGFEHVVVDIRRKPAPWRDFLALLRMVRLFRAHKYHIVHSTTPKAGLLAAIAAWLAGVPVRLHTFTGQPWVTMKGTLRWISRVSDCTICSLNTRVYADSPSQRQFLIDEGIVRADHIGVVGAGSLAGVDVQRFSQDRFSDEDRAHIRNELGISSEARVVTFIGRVTGEKGVNELLKAIHMLHQEGQAVELLLIGPSEEMLEANCAKDVKALDCGPRFPSYIHRVDYTEVPERFLSITDILCLPSYREGFGTVVIEAAAMGVPTVGSAITGLRDAIVQDTTGLLVPPKNVEALAAALRRLIVDQELRNWLSENAKQRCLEQFDAEIINRQLVQEYARLSLPLRRSVG